MPEQFIWFGNPNPFFSLQHREHPPNACMEIELIERLFESKFARVITTRFPMAWFKEVKPRKGNQGTPFLLIHF